MLQEEADSGNIHDVAYISTQYCLADCLTKASANADNLITAVKTGRLADVDIHPSFSTHGAQGLLVYMVQNIHAHKREGCFLPERSEDFSRTNSTRRTIPCDVCENSHTF